MSFLDANPRSIALGGQSSRPAPNPATDITPQMRSWCKHLARGGRLTCSGMHHCVALNAGPITYSMINRLEAAGLITLEPTASNTPELPHVRAVLTDFGRIVADEPREANFIGAGQNNALVMKARHTDNRFWPVDPDAA